MPAKKDVLMHCGNGPDGFFKEFERGGVPFAPDDPR